MRKASFNRFAYVVLSLFFGVTVFACGSKHSSEDASTACRSAGAELSRVSFMDGDIPGKRDIFLQQVGMVEKSQKDGPVKLLAETLIGVVGKSPVGSVSVTESSKLSGLLIEASQVSGEEASSCQWMVYATSVALSAPSVESFVNLFLQGVAETG